jgi:fructose-1,6-bisphosphatase I
VPQTKHHDLNDVLSVFASSSSQAADLAVAVKHLAAAAADVAGEVADGGTSGRLAEEGKTNVQGEVQKFLDVFSHNCFVEAARQAPVACLLSEEEDLPLTLSTTGTLALAIDPLDGSSNIAINSPIGTIFGLYPAATGGVDNHFLRPGRDLIAAGYFIYGPRTELVVSLGGKPLAFVLDASRRVWHFLKDCEIAQSSSEFAINMSNYRFWSERERQFVDQCLDGKDGPLGVDYNMRWLAALAGETHRIFGRGGIFFYPADRRKGYERGRLRYLYECAPIAYLVEKAGGVATDGADAILDLVPASLHERSPLCFGSAAQMRLFAEARVSSERQYSPLFSKRGLFRAGA